jgi:hypothetical protein
MTATRTPRRQSRTTPVADRPFRLTDRDEWILEALGKMRFLTTDQIAELGFHSSRWAANKRLRKLLDARLVRVWVQSLAAPNIYGLSGAGARLLGDAEEQSPIVVPRTLDGNLSHLLGINQVRVSLAVGLEAASHTLAWWQSDWDLRACFREPVIPDALFAVDWDDRSRGTFALEVDHETRSSRALVGKLLRYRSLLSRGHGLYGLGEVVTLVVGFHSRWITRHRRTLAHMGLGLRLWLASMDELRARGGLAEVWQAPGSDERHSLRTLGMLPYGKEGRGNGSSHQNGGSMPQPRVDMYPFMGIGGSA